MIDEPIYNMPNPTQQDLNDPIFESIWKVVKYWDIHVPGYYTGYCSGNGSHVKLILDEVRTAIRDSKINDILCDKN